MKLRLPLVATIARREFLAAVRRRAYVLTLILMPAYFVFVAGMGVLPSAMAKRSKEAKVVAFVDPGHALGLAQGTDADMTDQGKARLYPDVASAQAALVAGDVRSVVALAPDYLSSGATVRYHRSSGLLTGGRLGPPVTEFMRRRLLAARLDTSLVSRAVTPLADSSLVLQPHGGFSPENDARRIAAFALPMAFAFILSIGIFTSGGYLMQGMGEEKESRILESLIALVTPDELMFGKMIGLGAAGLGLVVTWGTLGGIALLFRPVSIAIGPGTILIAAYYFLVGYFLFGSFMLAVGSLVSSYQEANQWTALISLSALSPFFALSAILDQPRGPVAVGVSLFPWTAPVAMMMRLPSGEVPAWQLAVSMALLLVSALFMLRLAGRIFRVGLLLYGKTPNLPEILRWSKGA